MVNLVLRFFIFFLIFLLLAAVGWTLFTLNWSFSEGERAGYVQKLSHKGWLCKTWEGELVLVSMPGAIPEKFEFTVRDDEVAKKINGFAGQRVVLTYDQHKFIPTSCFGETEYFVSAAKLVEPPVSPAPAALPPSPAPAFNP
jgi:hypothetical protein